MLSTSANISHSFDFLEFCLSSFLSFVLDSSDLSALSSPFDLLVLSGSGGVWLSSIDSLSLLLLILFGKLLNEFICLSDGGDLVAFMSDEKFESSFGAPNLCKLNKFFLSFTQIE